MTSCRAILVTDPAVARCHREIAEAEAALLSGKPDEDELLVWMADWQWELRAIELERTVGREK